MAERSGAGLYLLLFVLWIFLNGKVTAEICLIGLAGTVLSAVLMYVLFRYSPRRDLRILSKAPFFLIYLGALLVEIFKANLKVIHIILHPEKEISQGIVLFEPNLRTGAARFILANSITLTPGTITVRAEKHRFTVHCLDRSLMDGFAEGTLMKLLRKLEA
ncbi:MAG: Na+/H+ antiporter subunit E [Clostridia bacterium]|nr:Na+/H+ antiporter subunit E [Clostridia bacterium]MBQ5758469.1 Na+/H+ antiporter subunit E [Clostridia bacterium]